LLIPDLVGMKLSKALELLDSKNIKDVQVIVTSPPKEENIANEDMRVIRLKSSDSGIIELLVCK